MTEEEEQQPKTWRKRLVDGAKTIDRGRRKFVDGFQELQKQTREFSDTTGIGKQGAAELLGGPSVLGDLFMGEQPKKAQKKKANAPGKESCCKCKCHQKEE